MVRPVLAAIAVAALCGLAACEHQGPAERAGSKLDKGTQSIGDAIDPPKGPAQSVGRSVDRALGQ